MRDRTGGREVSPGAVDVLPQQLLGKQEGGADKQQRAGQRVQLPHQAVLPADLGLVHRGRVGEDAARENFYYFVHFVCCEATQPCQS